MMDLQVAIGIAPAATVYVGVHSLSLPLGPKLSDVDVREGVRRAVG